MVNVVTTFETKLTKDQLLEAIKGYLLNNNAVESNQEITVTILQTSMTVAGSVEVVSVKWSG